MMCSSSKRFCLSSHFHEATLFSPTMAGRNYPTMSVSVSASVSASTAGFFQSTKLVESGQIPLDIPLSRIRILFPRRRLQRTLLRRGGRCRHEVGVNGSRNESGNAGSFRVNANQRNFQNRRRTNDSVNEGLYQSRDDPVQRKMEAFHEGKAGPPLRVLPIGGLGEIGMNCMLVGNYDRYIMIDAGLMFPDFDELGVQKVLPDTAFIRRWRHKIEALIITHGHEDHIGALPWVIPALDPTTPIYSTGFTMQLIKSRLKEYNIPAEGRCRIFEMRRRFAAGPFEVEPVRVTHSIPDCCGLVLRCQDGSIFHTGDWKIDESPVDGNIFDRTTLERLSKEGVTLMMSDSTNVLSPGRTTSEADVAKALMRRIASAKGRVITTQFASNVHRLGSVKKAAEETGRKMVFIGVSLRTYLEAAWRDGQAPFDPSLLVKADDMGAYAPRDLLIVTTGSQAEPRAALNLASYGTSRALKLNKDDLVLYSAKMIPGNETRVVRMMNRIAELGPTIIQGRGEHLHTSGHAYRDELEEVIRLVKPQHFLPVHGEFSFLKEHEQLGKANGILHTAVIKNGEMLGVSPLRNGRVLSSGFSDLGRENFKLMYNDGDRAYGTATDLCIHERMKIALEGMIIASVEVLRDPVGAQTGTVSEQEDQINEGEGEVGLRGRIRLTTRCLWLDGGKVLEYLRKAADAALATSWRDSSLVQIERKIAMVLRKASQKYVNRRPEVIVIATEGSPDVAAPASQKPVQDNSVTVRTFPSEVQKPRDYEGLSHSQPASSKDAKREPFVRASSAPLAEPMLQPSRSTSAREPLHEVAPSPEADAPASTSVVEESVVPDVPSASAAPDLVDSSSDSAVSGSVSVDGSRAKDDPNRSSNKVRSRKWMQKETAQLIRSRSSLTSEAQKGRTQRSIWRSISSALADAGFERTPEQCCSMWGSLVKKFLSMNEIIKSGAAPEKDWVHYEAMKRAMALQSEHHKNAEGQSESPKVAAR